jgi:hypothetical protein
MVKRLPFVDFINQLDSLYAASRDKHSVYLTFKRIYDEKFKYKNNKKIRKLRVEERKNEDKQNKKFNVLVRAKLKKSRIQTIVSIKI